MPVSLILLNDFFLINKIIVKTANKIIVRGTGFLLIGSKKVNNKTKNRVMFSSVFCRKLFIICFIATRCNNYLTHQLKIFRLLFFVKIK